MGNTTIGAVSEAGDDVDQFIAGDQVYAHLPIRETHTVSEEGRRERDANVRIGERVAVFGLGAIRLMIVQLAAMSAAQQIFAVDPLPNRRNLAETFGAGCSLDPASCDVGLQIKKATGLRGVDVAIEARGLYAALREAMRSIHHSGLVVTVSCYSGGGTALRLGEEWYHARLTMRSSMPVSSSQSYLSSKRMKAIV